MIVFCAATYGEGDPPENAVVFHEWLMDESLEDTLLKGSRFAVREFGIMI
jgi:sulfite reductase alpha subunit-like flavoprotein